MKRIRERLGARRVWAWLGAVHDGGQLPVLMTADGEPVRCRREVEEWIAALAAEERDGR